MYGFELAMSLMTVGARSRAIPDDEMFANEHSAKPTMYWLGWLRSLYHERWQRRHGSEALE